MSAAVSMRTAAIEQAPATLVTIAGRPVQVETWETQHGVDQPIGTASLTLPLPLPSFVGLNVPVEIQAGYRDSGTHRVFSGRITDIDRDLDDGGSFARVRCTDWMELLDYTDESDLVFPGLTLLADIFRSLCRRRRVPMYTTDHVFYANGFTHVYFGGNPYIDNGDVIIEKRTSPLQWLDRKARLVGYRVYGAPNGQARLTRVSGKPDTAVYGGAEGVDVVRMGRVQRLSDMATFWEINGASYTDGDGVPIKIRSIPASVPPDPLLTPPGYRGRTLSDRDIVTQGRADSIRQIYEIDYSAPRDIVTWETAGNPHMQPGDSIYVTSSTLEIDPSYRWVMTVRHAWSDRGFWTTFEGWAGAGTQLPHGNDATTVHLATGPFHLGDEVVPWYAVPAPRGSSLTLPFTVPDTYTAIVLTGLGHGINSQLIDGSPQDELKVSKVEVFQNGESVGTIDLPVMPEDYWAMRDYHNLANWVSFRKPLPGSLEPGRAELVITAGENSGYDDFEVRDLALTLTGVGAPVLPNVR